MVRLTKEILANYMPHGSGIDGTWYIEEKGRYFHASCSYHMMDDAGYYVGWYDFYVKVPKDQPQKFNITVEGHDEDADWLETYLTDVISDTMDELVADMKKKPEKLVDLKLPPWHSRFFADEPKRKKPVKKLKYADFWKVKGGY